MSDNRIQTNYKIELRGDTVDVVSMESNSVVTSVSSTVEDPETGETLELGDLVEARDQKRIDRWQELALLPHLGDGARLEHSVLAERERLRAVPTVSEFTIPDVSAPLSPSQRRPPAFSKSEYAIEGYLLALETLRAKSVSGPDRPGSRHAWLALRDARIFSVDANLAHPLLDAWMDSQLSVDPGRTLLDPWINTQLAHIEGQDESPPGEADVPAVENPPWPVEFPFGSMWFGYNGCLGTQFDQSGNWASWGDDLSVDEKVERHLNEPHGDVFGHLVTERGELWSFIRNAENEVNVYLSHTAAKGWHEEYVIYSDLPPLVVEYINQQRTFIMETDVPGLRRRMKRDRKLLGLTGKKLVPPPYYRIRVRSRVIKKAAESAVLGYPRTFRHDVRGHERCRVRRGDLPLAHSDRQKLEGLGYQVFTVQPLDAATLTRLAQRGLPIKKANEWLAIQVRWIEPHVSPADESLPYVPALREVKA